MGRDRWKKAVRYARHGFKVHPLRPNRKEPLLEHGWPKRATDNIQKIKGWWEHYTHDGQEPNIGIACGHGSGIVVLDVDGEEGEESLRELTEGRKWGETTLAITPNGKHYYFAYDTTKHGELSNRQGFKPGLDFRTDGGYVVAPGSVVDGEPYRWNPMLDPMTTSPAELPEWLLHEVQNTGGSGKNENRSVEDYATEEIPEKVEGELLCPLLKKSKKFDTNPPDSWAPGPGRRHRFFLEKALTHFNLGLSRDYIEAVFFKKVWPSMDKSPGHDGKPFTAREFHEILDWAEKNAEGELPKNVVQFHEYHNKRTKGKNTRGQSRGKTKWRGTQLWQTLSLFMEEQETVTCSTMIEGKEAYEVLAEQLHEWARRKKINENEVPLRSLKRWVQRLTQWGVIDKEIEREGSGHVVFTLRLASSNGASVPRARIKRDSFPNQGKTLRTRDTHDPPAGSKFGSDPPSPGKTPQNPVEMIRDSTLTVPYPGLSHRLDNVDKQRRHVPNEKVKAYHIVAWITDEHDFPCWIYRHVARTGLWQVLNEYEEHHEEIESPGAWFRQRIRNRFNNCEAV